jgi:hypothetical protein
MEDNRKSPERSVQRSFECTRLEEQLWAMAYEELWPVVQRSLRERRELPRRRERSSGETRIARRA